MDQITSLDVDDKSDLIKARKYAEIKTILCTADAFRHRFIASKLSEFNIDLLVIHEATQIISNDNHFIIREQVEREFFENEIHDNIFLTICPEAL